MKKLAVLLLVVSGVVNAQSYKCVVNNVTTFQALPCTNGHQEVIEIKESPVNVQATTKNGGVEIGTLEIMVSSVSESYTDYHPKVAVTNKTANPIDLSLRYDGLDYKGFVIDYFYLKGKVDANSYRTISDTRSMKNEKYQSIVKWQLHE